MSCDRQRGRWFAALSRQPAVQQALGVDDAAAARQALDTIYDVAVNQKRDRPGMLATRDRRAAAIWPGLRDRAQADGIALYPHTAKRGMPNPPMLRGYLAVAERLGLIPTPGPVAAASSAGALGVVPPLCAKEQPMSGIVVDDGGNWLGGNTGLRAETIARGRDDPTTVPPQQHSDPPPSIGAAAPVGWKLDEESGGIFVDDGGNWLGGSTGLRAETIARGRDDPTTVPPQQRAAFTRFCALPLADQEKALQAAQQSASRASGRAAAPTADLRTTLAPYHDEVLSTANGAAFDDVAFRQAAQAVAARAALPMALRRQALRYVAETSARNAPTIPAQRALAVPLAQALARAMDTPHCPQCGRFDGPASHACPVANVRTLHGDTLAAVAAGGTADPETDRALLLTAQRLAASPALPPAFAALRADLDAVAQWPPAGRKALPVPLAQRLAAALLAAEEPPRPPPAPTAMERQDAAPHPEAPEPDPVTVILDDYAVIPGHQRPLHHTLMDDDGTLTLASHIGQGQHTLHRLGSAPAHLQALANALRQYANQGTDAAPVTVTLHDYEPAPGRLRPFHHTIRQDDHTIVLESRIGDGHTTVHRLGSRPAHLQALADALGRFGAQTTPKAAAPEPEPDDPAPTPAQILDELGIANRSARRLAQSKGDPS